MSILRGISLDFELALQRLKRDMRDEWFPDALSFGDMADVSRVTKIFSDSDYEPQLAEPFDLPKLGFTLRYSLETSFPDRIIYQAIIDTLAAHYDALLLPTVFSYRFNGPDQRYMFHSPVHAWLDFKRAVRAEIGAGSRVLLATDVQNYFEAINLRLLKDTLSERSDHSRAMLRTIAVLYQLLSQWSVFKGVGIPQNRDASSFLGNVFLMPVDDAMIRAGYRYFRYMDDIQIICDDAYHARRAIKDLIIELRRVHLNVNAKKTFIIRADDIAIEEVLPPPNPKIERIDEAWRSGDAIAIKKTLPSLRRYTKLLIDNGNTSSREFKFCVNRLEKVARNKEFDFDFSGIGDAVAYELMAQPWHTDLLVRYLEAVDVSGSVISILADILSDPQKNIYDWQSYHLWKILGQVTKSDNVLLRLARKHLRAENSSAPMRAGAILYLGAHGAQNDRNRIAQSAAHEESRFVKRAILIAAQEVSKTVRSKYVTPEVAPEFGLSDPLDGVGFEKLLYFAEPESLTAEDMFVDLSTFYAS